ncbi:hypothetical protein ACFFP0_26725 [Rhizobium puerariae]|uniref:Uncharacterized protein n=1 Tax=Rhizobium puerariae TaxID=1585791 RepID=A0ABV6APA9_9HYPH
MRGVARKTAARHSTIDPLAQAIADFRSGMAKFCELPDFGNGRQHEDAIAATYRPPQDALERWEQPATTRIAAIEALRLADEEKRDHADSRIIKAMVRASLRFFETEPQTSADCAGAISQIHDAIDFLTAICMAADAFDENHASAMKVVGGAAIDCLNLALDELREMGWPRKVAA